MNLSEFGITSNPVDLPEPTGGNYEPIPNQWLLLKITGIEKNQKGTGIQIETVVQSVEFANRKIWTNFTLNSDNTDLEKKKNCETISQAQIGELMRSIHTTNVQFDTWIGSDVYGYVTQNKFNDKIKNEVKRFKPIDAPSIPPAPQQSAPAKTSTGMPKFGQ